MTPQTVVYEPIVLADLIRVDLAGATLEELDAEADRLWNRSVADGCNPEFSCFLEEARALVFVARDDRAGLERRTAKATLGDVITDMDQLF